MEIKDFVKEGKLVIPEEEIDKVYVWTKITSTQEVLMSSEVCYKWMKKSFDTDVSRYLEVIKKSYPMIDSSTYQLSDFITFNANRSNIFSDKKKCFVYCSNYQLLASLVCYTSHTLNLFNIQDTELSDIVFNKIDEPEKIKQYLSSEILMISANMILPEHKHKQMILNSMISERTRNNYCTFIHTLNEKQMLFNDDEQLMQNAIRRGAKNLNPLIKPWIERRGYDYHKLMSTWYSMLSDYSCLVYSDTEPLDRVRNRERYN